MGKNYCKSGCQNELKHHSIPKGVKGNWNADCMHDEWFIPLSQEHFKFTIFCIFCKPAMYNNMFTIATFLKTFLKSVHFLAILSSSSHKMSNYVRNILFLKD